MREVKVKAWAPERFYKWRGTVVVVIISAQSAEKNFWCPHFSVVPTQFLMELGAQPSVKQF